MEPIGNIIDFRLPNWTDEQWEAHDLRIRELNATEEQEAERDRQEARCRLLVSQGASRRLLGLHPEQTEARIQLAHAMSEPGGHVVVLSGGVGSGKTTAVLHWMLGAKSRPWWTSAAAFARSNRYDTPQPWQLARCGVIDDLGVEYLDKKGSYLTDLDEVIDHFYSQGKRLVLTTNLPPVAFRHRYGERIRSRITASGVFLVIKTKDMR